MFIRHNQCPDLICHQSILIVTGNIIQAKFVIDRKIFSTMILMMMKMHMIQPFGQSQSLANADEIKHLLKSMQQSINEKFAFHNLS